MHGLQRIESDQIDAVDPITTKRGGDIHDFQVKCVCGGDNKSCNNGWMRRLENQSRPIMVPLMNGEETRLYPHQQKVLAGWAATKAVVAEHDPLGRITTTQAERDHIMSTQLPPSQGWSIWIGYYERQKWEGYLGSTPFAFWPGPENAHLLGVPTPDFNGQASFQVVKKLFIQIIRCVVPEVVEKWRFDAKATSVIRRIWPVSEYSIVWPTPVMSDHDADYVCSAFSIAAVRGVRRRLARDAGQTPAS
jgi:hypothetical protein